MRLFDELPTPNEGERWTDGRGTVVKIHYCAQPGAEFVGRVLYVRVSLTAWHAAKSTSTSLPNFRKRFRPEST